ncbi:MAG: alpha/beta hydrolase family protein, partial [Bryobacteraceae bacterium]
MLIIRSLVATAVVWTLSAQDPLPGTTALTVEGDLAARMVDGINGYLIRETEAALERRPRYWKRDHSSPAAYEQSVSVNREQLRRIVGAADPRAPVTSLMLDSTTAHDSVVGKGAGYRIHAVRWPVFDGVVAEGLL